MVVEGDIGTHGLLDLAILKDKGDATLISDKGDAILISVIRR